MSKKCTPVNPTSMDWCEGSDMNPGIRPRVYFIPKSLIASWPTLPTTISESGSMAELVKYKGNFTLAASEKWRHMDIIDDKSGVTAEPQGTKPSKVYENKATLVVALADEEAAGFSKLARNGDFVYIVQDRAGRFRIIGSEAYRTNTNCSFSTGNNPTDDGAGMTLEITCYDSSHAPFYEGEIITEAGTINGG